MNTTQNNVEKFLEFIESADIEMMREVAPAYAGKVAELEPGNARIAAEFSKIIRKGYTVEDVQKNRNYTNFMEVLKPQQFEQLMAYKDELEHLEIDSSEVELFLKIIDFDKNALMEPGIVMAVIQNTYTNDDVDVEKWLKVTRHFAQYDMLDSLYSLTRTTTDMEILDVFSEWPLNKDISFYWIKESLSSRGNFGRYTSRVSEEKMARMLNIALQYENPNSVLKYFEETEAASKFELDKIQMKIEKGFFNPDPSTFEAEIYGDKYAQFLKTDDLRGPRRFKFVEKVIKNKKAARLFEAVQKILKVKDVEGDYIQYTVESIGSCDRVMSGLNRFLLSVNWKTGTEEDLEWVLNNVDVVGAAMKNYENDALLDLSMVVKLTKILSQAYQGSLQKIEEHSVFSLEESLQKRFFEIITTSTKSFADLTSELRDTNRLTKLLTELDKFKYPISMELMAVSMHLDNDEKYDIKNYYEYELLKQYPGAKIEQARKLNIRGDSYKYVKAMMEDDFMNSIRPECIEELAESGFFNIIKNLSSSQNDEAYKLLAKAVLLDKFEELKYPKGDLEKELELSVDDQLEGAWKVNEKMKSGLFQYEEADDFISLITIGNAPIETCLNTTTGSHKKAALSMMDSNKKLLKATYKGNYALRSVLRLCKIADKAPVKRPLDFVDVESLGSEMEVETAVNERVALFLEIPYTYLGDEQKEAAMKGLIKLAKVKAKNMNCELVLSTPYGELVKRKAEECYLHISHSKNGIQYIDSLAGQYGENSFGYYAKGDFVVIKP